VPMCVGPALDNPALVFYGRFALVIGAISAVKGDFHRRFP